MAPIGGGGGWGAVAPSPKIPNFFLLVSLIQCSIYVHAYQALVHFSTWTDFHRGCWYRAFGMTAQKKFPLRPKFFCPPRNLWIGATDLSDYVSRVMNDKSRLGNSVSYSAWQKMHLVDKKCNILVTMQAGWCCCLSYLLIYLLTYLLTCHVTPLIQLETFFTAIFELMIRIMGIKFKIDVQTSTLLCQNHALNFVVTQP